MYQTIIGGKEYLDMAIKLIKQGELVAFPTETVYGLGANALDKNAVNKIFIAKNRPFDNPLIVHVASVRQAEVVAFVSNEAKMLFESFSPGPLTVILPKKPNLPKEVTGDINTVGIRIPNNKMALELITKSNLPIAAPSANISQKVSPTSAKFVFEDMNGKIPLILDGGECEVGIESTVLTLESDIPTILRPGAVTVEMLTKVLPKVRSHTGEIRVAESPGMKYKHYAPSCECVMFENIYSGTKFYDEQTKNGKKAVMLITNDKVDTVGARSYVDMGKTGEEIAHNVFRILREAEKKYDCIIIEKLPPKGIYASIMNRLEKSSSGKTV
ncbi:MAG: threonylcarbamoyl-AMP synthase [Clostridiales bacterium]|nr:threonylcarbamoyl-AMP synthase [Clostridiales bacterium]